MGGQISWLIPAALILAAGALWLFRRRAGNDRQRGAVLMWVSWLVVTGTVFSFAQGIIHPYYTVALAPAVAALVGLGATSLWAERSQLGARLFLAAALAATAVWAVVLLDRSPAWLPWLRPLVLVAAVWPWPWPWPWCPAAGPGRPGPGRGRDRGGPGRPGRLLPGHGQHRPLRGHPLGRPCRDRGGRTGGGGPTHRGPGLGRPGRWLHRPPRGLRRRRGERLPRPDPEASRVRPPARAVPRAGGWWPGGRWPGLRWRRGRVPQCDDTRSAVVETAQTDASRYTWVAATVDSNSAAGYQLATFDPIMAIGGFNGTDPAPTLAQFEADVAAGRIHYFIGGGTGLGGSSTGTTAGAITRWVEGRYTATTVDGVTLYDLSPTGR